MELLFAIYNLMLDIAEALYEAWFNLTYQIARIYLTVVMFVRLKDKTIEDKRRIVKRWMRYNQYIFELRVKQAQKQHYNELARKQEQEGSSINPL